MTRTLLLIGGAAMLLAAYPAQAQERYLGSIIPFANSFCPYPDTVEAAGQIISIPSNTALFSLYGTTYGGNGTTTFALPDLRGRAPVSNGAAPGMSVYVMGQIGGAESIQLTPNELASHTHSAVMRAYNGNPDIDSPAGAALADFPSTTMIYNNNTAPSVQMAANSVQTLPTGNDAPVPLNSPYVTIRYCVVTQGIYPVRP